MINQSHPSFNFMNGKGDILFNKKLYFIMAIELTIVQNESQYVNSLHIYMLYFLNFSLRTNPINLLFPTR